MLYRTIQKKLRSLKSTIALNQKKYILLRELEYLLAAKQAAAAATVPVVEYREIRSPVAINAFMKTVDRSLCKNLGSQPYWEGLVAWPVDVVIHAVQAGTTVGFVLVRNDYVCTKSGCGTHLTHNAFYIELICGQGGVGSRLIDHVKKLARQENKSNIHLSALFDVISYYASKHQFMISTGCYPRMEAEIGQLLDLHVKKHTIQSRRVTLTTQMKTDTITKQMKASITAERRRLTTQMTALGETKTELLEKLKASSTFQLKNPGRTTTVFDVLDEGVFMSFCL